MILLRRNGIECAVGVFVSWLSCIT